MPSIETPALLMILIEGKEVRSNGTDLTTQFQAPIAHMAPDDMDTWRAVPLITERTEITPIGH